MFPLVRELAAHEHPVRVPVTVTCRVLRLCRQQYYRWLACPVSDAELAWAYRANALFDAHRDDPAFGYRYCRDEAGDEGQQMSPRTAWAICSANSWWSVFAKKRAGRPRPGPPVHDDLLAFEDDKGRTRHDFTAAEQVNTVWLTDITEHKTNEGKLYLCAIKDACSGRIVGYSIDSRMKSKLAVAALNSAVSRRTADDVGVAGCIVHSDGA
uniref:DDE-type integrase/transposase/recombinase n=2 Tax=Nigerium massiliense TaxID=1522317 RepID=UPI0012FD3996|nr:DDE-type integrase/transposase/recombinase [Nigerium massiliense]